MLFLKDLSCLFKGNKILLKMYVLKPLELCSHFYILYMNFTLKSWEF